MGAAQRVGWVDVAKGLSILLVALYHSTLMISGVGIDVDWVLDINEALAPLRMPLFFMASGFFARSSIAGSWGDTWRRRILFLGYLFAVWTVIRWGFFALVPNPWTPGEGEHLRQIVTAFLLPRTGLWFLWELALFYFLTKSVTGLSPRLVTLLGTLASIVGFMHVLPLPFAYENFLKYFVFFYAACHYREIIARLPGLRRWPIILITATAFCVLTYAVQAVDSSLFDGIALFVSALFSVACLVAASSLVSASMVGLALSYLGQHTLQIYLAHVMLVAVMAHIYVALDADRLGLAVLALPLVSVAVVAPLCLGLEWAAKRLGATWLYAVPSFLMRAPKQPALPAETLSSASLSSTAISESAVQP